MGRAMTACLAILAVTGILGCVDTPVQVPTRTISANVAGTDSVALTYICGNMFRIRNLAFDPRSVRWDIYRASPADTGSLWARGRDLGSAYVDLFVTARTNGTMRLFVGATLVATKANGNKVACAAPVDSSAMTQGTIVPPIGTVVQTNAPIVLSADSTLYRRTLVNLQFRDGATNWQRRDFQRRYNAQLVGVYGSIYQIRLPDLGASYTEFKNRLDLIDADAIILRARPLRALERSVTFNARFPDDAPGLRRVNYINRDSLVWPALAMRLPQAWRCETGRYGSTLPRIAIYEQNFPAAAAPDVSPSLLTPVVRNTTWRNGLSQYVSSVDSIELVEHGHAVASLVSASGDNGVGIAGPLWRADLRVITPSNTDKKLGAGAVFFYDSLYLAILRASPQILSLSSDVAMQTDTLQRATDIIAITLRFRTLLDSLPRLLIVQAAGDDSYVGVYSARDTSTRTMFQNALVTLSAESQAYRDRIIFVGSSNRHGNRASQSNAYTGLVDLYAPGIDVPILAPDGTLYLDSGTSFAAPAVAGIAGQLLAMDATLSGSELKSLLVAGARDSIEDSNGNNVAPSPIGNTSDVVYEVDAYGSLRLLSSQRLLPTHVGVPLCGATVVPFRDGSARIEPDFDRFAVRIHRYGAATDELLRTDVDGQPLLYSFFGPLLSVAPGGRALSVSSVTAPNEDSRTNHFRLNAGTWQAVELSRYRRHLS